ncbi:MAG: Hpt domain-containing protein [Ferruginibacter sp.]|nr:Hpt domain-containing protein [Chitinophagaceae bacterium]
MPVSVTNKSSTNYELPRTAAPVKVCNLKYQNSITRGNKATADNLVKIFFTEINEELAHLQIAIEESNYHAISNIAHKMKSAFAILGITELTAVINEMEHLSTMSSSIEIINQLTQQIHFRFTQAKVEMKYY